MGMKKFELPGQLDWSGSTQEERAYQNAVDRVRLAHEVSKAEKLYVAFSGGKDSTVLWAIVCDAAEKDGVPIEQYAERHYNMTGIDPPELVYHMRNNCPDLIWHMYDVPFWRLIIKKGRPRGLQDGAARNTRKKAVPDVCAVRECDGRKVSEGLASVQRLKTKKIPSKTRCCLTTTEKPGNFLSTVCPKLKEYVTRLSTGAQITFGISSATEICLIVVYTTKDLKGLGA